MNVLSLFDGIGTGRYALDKAGIKVDKYYASEIDKNAISIAQYNYPDIIQIGDVESIDFNSLKGKIDLIIGGFPCTDLSLAGKRDGLKGQHSRLFYKQLEAIKIIQPKYFLVENNVGMPKDAYEEISKQLGCYPTEINSALVSAQNRRRYYWTNIGPKMRGLVGLPKCAIPQPKDRGIILEDILEKDANIVPENTTSVSYVEKHLKSLSDKLDYTPVQFNAYNEQEIKDKSSTLTTACGGKTSLSSVNKFTLHCVNIPESVTVRKHDVDVDNLKKLLKSHKKYSSKEIAKRLSIPVTMVEHWFRTDDYFAIPDAELWQPLKELLDIESTEFDKAITEFEVKPSSYDKATRKYCTDGKMSTLMAGGNDEIIFKDNSCKNIPYRLYSVQNGTIKIGDTVYPINLPDGDYSIRHLTPLECERLQTMPDGYTQFGREREHIVKISNAQRYKALGNGWTAEVIIHIFRFMEE